MLSCAVEELRRAVLEGMSGNVRHLANALTGRNAVSGITFKSRGKRTTPMPQTSRRALLTGAMMLGATAAAAAQDKTAQPIEGKKGATILGPRDPAREIENPDFL